MCQKITLESSSKDSNDFICEPLSMTLPIQVASRVLGMPPITQFRLWLGREGRREGGSDRGRRAKRNQEEPGGAGRSPDDCSHHILARMRRSPPVRTLVRLVSSRA